MKKIALFTFILIGFTGFSQVHDYVFSVVDQEIKATSLDYNYPNIISRDLADITEEIQKTRIDPLKTKNGSFNVSLFFNDGIYNAYRGIEFSGGYPTNTEATKLQVTFIGESHIGVNIRLNKANTGQDVLTFTDGLRVKLEDFTITALGGNGKALYLKAPSQSGGFSVRDSRINNVYTYHSTEGFSVVMENMFSVVCPRIKVVNFLGSGINLRNNSKTTNYGNSLFGKIDVSTSGNDNTTGFKISTLEDSNKLMNLISIEYLELGSILGEGNGSNAKGVYVKDCGNLTIGKLVSEYLGRNVHLENASNITISNTLLTIERGSNQLEGEAYGYKLDNCSNVKILNGIYYTRDYTAAPVIINDSAYKGGNYIAGELVNGFSTSLIQQGITKRTELNFHQNGNPNDLLGFSP